MRLAGSWIQILIFLIAATLRALAFQNMQGGIGEKKIKSAFTLRSSSCTKRGERKAWRTSPDIQGRKLQYGLRITATQEEKWSSGSSVCMATTDPGPESPSDLDDIFGAEFRGMGSTGDLPVENEPAYYLRKDKKGVGYKQEVTKVINPEKRGEVMAGFDNMRASFIGDSIFVSLIGLCLVWCFGTFKDATSYGLGAVLGGFYAISLSAYVEKLGSSERNTLGNLRFAPVILLIAVYSRNKEYVSIIPELIGFSSYQVGSLLQIFNEGAYDGTPRPPNT